MYQIKVDPNKCIGAASCVGLAPKTFKLNQDNIAYVISENKDKAEQILLAAQACPTQAIIIIDKKTGKQIWPKVIPS